MKGWGQKLELLTGLLLQEVTMASLHEQRFTEEKPLLRGQDAEMENSDTFLPAVDTDWKEHDIETPYGLLHVVLRGSTRGNRPALLTYHDVGLNRLIVATLAICWLPNQVRRIMMAARPKQDWTVSYFRAYIILLPIADIFFYLSSVVNPLLYNVSSQHFRKVFLQILRCHLSIEHANKQKYLATSLNSVANVSHSKRPLIFMSSRRKSSTKAAQKVSSNILQDEAEIDSNSPKRSPESLELNVRSMPLETSLDPSPVNQNGVYEHE